MVTGDDEAVEQALEDAIQRDADGLDLKLIRSLAHIQCTLPEIASVLDVDVAILTARADVVDAVERGHVAGQQSIRRRQWQLAQEGNVPMLIWLGRVMLGQTAQAEGRDRFPFGKDPDRLQRRDGP